MSWKSKPKKAKKKPTEVKNVINKAANIKIVKSKAPKVINIKDKSVKNTNVKSKVAESKNVKDKKIEIKDAMIQDLENKEMEIENLESKQEEIKVSESKEDVEIQNEIENIMSKIKFVKLKPEWSVTIPSRLESGIIDLIYNKVKEQYSLTIHELLTVIVVKFFGTEDFPEELDDENLWLIDIIQKCCYLRIDNDGMVILDSPKEFPHKSLHETKQIIIATFDAMDWLVCEIGLGNLRKNRIGDHKNEPGLFSEILRRRIRDEIKKVTEESFKLFHQISLLADAIIFEGHHLADYNAYALRLYEFQDILKPRNIKVIVNGVRTREVEINPLGELSLHEQLSLNGQEDRLYDVTIFKVDKLNTWDDGRLVPMTKITWRLINENLECIFQIIPYKSNFPIILPNTEEKKEETLPSAQLKPLEVKGGSTVTLQDVVLLLSTLNGNFMALNNQFTTNFNTLNGNFNTLNGNFNTLNSNVNHKIDSLDNKFENKFNSLEGRFDSLEGDFKKLDVKVSRLDDTVNRLDDSVRKLDKRVESLEDTTRNLDKRVGALENAVDILKDNVRELKDIVGKLNNTVTRLDEKVFELEGSVRKLNNASSYATLSDNIDDLGRKLDALRKTVNTLNNTSNSYRKSIEKIPSVEGGIEELRNQYTEITTLALKLDSTTGTLDKINGTIGQIENRATQKYNEWDKIIKTKFQEFTADLDEISRNVSLTRNLMHYQREAALASVITTMLSSILKKDPIHEKLLISLPRASPLLGIRLYMSAHNAAFLQTNTALLGNKIFYKYLRIVQSIAQRLREYCKINLSNNSRNSIEYNLVSRRDVLELTDRQEEERKNNKRENEQKIEQEPGIIIETTGACCDYIRLAQTIQNLESIRIQNDTINDPSQLLDAVDHNTYVLLHHILQLIRQVYFFKYKTGNPAQIVGLESPTFKYVRADEWKTSWGELTTLIESLKIPFYLLSWEK